MTKLTKASLESLVVSETYTRPDNSTLTVCVLALRGGVKVLGQSNCIDPANYDADIGKQAAREDAIEKMWELEGYHLKRISPMLIQRAAMAGYEAIRMIRQANDLAAPAPWPELPEHEQASLVDQVYQAAQSPKSAPINAQTDDIDLDTIQNVAFANITKAVLGL